VYYEACAYNEGHPLRALRIGHATSHDAVRWTKDTANPVLRNGSIGDWDDEAVWDPFVMYDAEVGLFKMWYGGQAEGFVNIQWGYVRANRPSQTTTLTWLWTVDQCARPCVCVCVSPFIRP
jgi:hypothetical protein